MKFAEIPVVFLSYDEPNADANWEHLKGQHMIFPLRSHGVKGFDAAHKAACALALQVMPETTHFFTVDADTQIFRWVWDSNIENLCQDYLGSPGQFNKTTFSWRSINNLNGLAYGNGGLKLWSVEFVQNMQTHEASEDKGVDFCWNDHYMQMSAITGVTCIDGSAYQAWRAGFREGVKMMLNGGTVTPKHKQYINIDTDLNLQRLVQWSSVGEDNKFGLYAIHGTLSGFDYVHVQGNATDLVLDYDVLKKFFDDAPKRDLDREILDLRSKVSGRLGFQIPRFGPNQSKSIKMMINMAHKKTSVYEKEKWDRLK
jgi:hypothetical protein